MFKKQEIPVAGPQKAEQVRRLEQAVRDALARAEKAEGAIEEHKEMAAYWKMNYDRVARKYHDQEGNLARMRDENRMLLKDLLRLQGPIQQQHPGLGGDGADMLFRDGPAPAARPRGFRINPFGDGPVPEPAPAPHLEVNPEYEELLRQDRAERAARAEQDRARFQRIIDNANAQQANVVNEVRVRRAGAGLHQGDFEVMAGQLNGGQWVDPNGGPVEPEPYDAAPPDDEHRDIPDREF